MVAGARLWSRLVAIVAVIVAVSPLRSACFLIPARKLGPKPLDKIAQQCSRLFVILVSFSGP